MIRFNGVANLTQDPEVVKIGETTKVNFSIACNDPFQKDKDKSANFFNCEMWGKGAEAFANYHAKGDKVYIVGRLVQERWEKDGEKRQAVKLKADDFEFVKTRDNNSPATVAAGTFVEDPPF